MRRRIEPTATAPIADRPARRMTHHVTTRSTTIAGGVTTPARVPRRRRQRRHQGERQASTSRCSSPTRRPRRPRSSRRTRRRRRRCSCRASIWRVSGGIARAIIVNSGCANACTGDDGLQVARDMAAETARLRRLPGRAGAGRVDRRHRRRPDDRQDPRRRCRAAIAALGADQGAGRRAGHHDDRSVSQGSGGPRLRSAAATSAIGGMAKGSGMIEPMMATMLGFVTTDAAVPLPLLAARAARGRRRHVQRHHRRRRVLDQRLRDAAGQRRERRRRSTRRATRRSSHGAARRSACELALGIVRGGEGATKLVTVTVTGARVDAPRRARAAKAIANSPLVKTAIHGGDPNWGRLIAVAGRAGVAFELVARGGARSARSCSSRTAGRTTKRRPRRPTYLKNDDIAVVGRPRRRHARRPPSGRAI